MNLHVATRKGLFRLEQQNGTWSVVDTAFLGDPVTYVLPSDGKGRSFAALKHGHFGPKLHRAERGSYDFSECSAPAYEKTENGPSVEQLWTLAAAGERLWCGTIPGGLFESTDGGDTWCLNEPLWNQPSRENWFGGGYDKPGIHSLVAHPSRPDRLMVGISCGGVWLSEDAGKTWETRTEGMFAAYMPQQKRHEPTIQDPHCVVQCSAEPDVLWQQHHNAMFKSEDGGQNWRELEVPVSAFGFAVAAHPKDPKTAWYVPAKSDGHRIPVDGKMVVARTRDGGESFDVLTQGLPQQHAYDLVFRHGLDVDSSGDVLAMGSTTGNLWVSENQGDSWQLVNAHLPPIYCVRFD